MHCQPDAGRQEQYRKQDGEPYSGLARSPSGDDEHFWSRPALSRLHRASAIPDLTRIGFAALRFGRSE